MNQNNQSELRSRKKQKTINLTIEQKTSSQTEKKQSNNDHPQTPNFYKKQSSLLDFDNLIGKDFSAEQKSNLSFDGFVNLGVIFLISTCALLAYDNYCENGVLIDLELLRCMSGDLFRCVDLMLLIPAQIFSVYFISRVQMTVFSNFGAKEKKGAKTMALMLVYWLCILLYVFCLLCFASAIVFAIVVKRVSLLVSCCITLALMVYNMKLHSYYAYVSRTFTYKTFQEQKQELKEQISKAPVFKEQKVVDEKLLDAQKTPDDFSDDIITVVSLKEYLCFMMFPTLCFFRHYPRTSSIRITYVLKELFLFVGSLLMMYILLMQFIDPIIKKQSYHKDNVENVILSVLKISVPWFITWLLGSFAIFHAFLNLIAELTYFADRLWYKDWWNSTSFEEFWKLWNRPVHHWLLKHVYFQSIRLNFSRPFAILFTFLLSAFLHELCMSIIFRTIRYYFFVAMLAQVPFIFISNKLKQYESLNRLGNMSMWLSLFTGQPLMLLLYFKNWYANERALCDSNNIANDYINQVNVTSIISNLSRNL